MNTKFFTEERITKTGRAFIALSSPSRIQIIHLLYKHKKLNVSELQNYLNIEQSQVSCHLKKLKLFQIVKSNRKGKTVDYILNTEIIEQFEQALSIYK